MRTQLRRKGLSMPDLYTAVFGGCMTLAVISLPAIVYYGYIVGREFRRAVRAYEIPPISSRSGGLPLVVIFTKNWLPRVENQRRKLSRAISVFVVLILVMMVVAQIFGPR
jgi:integral membrane sensor domain MASE1